MKKKLCWMYINKQKPRGWKESHFLLWATMFWTATDCSLVGTRYIHRQKKRHARTQACQSQLVTFIEDFRFCMHTFVYECAVSKYCRVLLCSLFLWSRSIFFSHFYSLKLARKGAKIRIGLSHSLSLFFLNGEPSFEWLLRWCQSIACAMCTQRLQSTLASYDSVVSM